MNLPPPTNQTAEVLNLLITKKTITRQSVFQDTGILNLTARLSDLRNAGLKIICEAVQVQNKFGRKIQYGKWKIEGDEHEVIKLYKTINLGGK